MESSSIPSPLSFSDFSDPPVNFSDLSNISIDTLSSPALLLPTKDFSDPCKGGDDDHHDDESETSSLSFSLLFSQSSPIPPSPESTRLSSSPISLTSFQPEMNVFDGAEYQHPKTNPTPDDIYGVLLQTPVIKRDPENERRIICSMFKQDCYRQLNVNGHIFFDSAPSSDLLIELSTFLQWFDQIICKQLQSFFLLQHEMTALRQRQTAEMLDTYTFPIISKNRIYLTFVYTVHHEHKFIFSNQLYTNQKFLLRKLCFALTKALANTPKQFMSRDRKPKDEYIDFIRHTLNWAIDEYASF